MNCTGWGIYYYIISLYGDTVARKYGDHFEMYRNIESLCSVIGTSRDACQLHFKN